jgi:hypothetical protein
MSGNDDFFGGSITPPTTPPAPGSQVNPHLAQNKEYGQYGGTSTVKASSSSTQPLVIGAIVLVIALVGFFGYRMYFGGGAIEMPDELIGLERIDPDSDMGRAIEESWNQLRSVTGDDVTMHIGAYTDGPKTMVVVAGEDGSSDASDVGDFFNGMAEKMKTQLPTSTLKDADAGSHGGTMKCFEVAQSGVKAGACVWLADETFGMLVVGPLDSDIAETTRQVREIIEN